MSDLYNRIVNQRGDLENLIARIPGFKGYHEKAARRTADRMLRDHIASQVQKCIDKMVRIEKIILDNGGLAYMSKTRDVKGRIQLYHDLVATAAPKYSGMWAQMKIGPDELDQIYAFDEAQIRYPEKMDMALEKLKEAALQKEGIDEALMELDDVAVEAREAFALRDDVITNFEHSL